VVDAEEDLEVPAHSLGSHVELWYHSFFLQTYRQHRSRVMRIKRLVRASCPLLSNYNVKAPKAVGLLSQARWLSLSATEAKAADLSRTRNIGIIAHIDAGKTTTTERMLYYSGFTRTIGNVDQGSTVTDFLPAERARGITIQSAAINFRWPPIPDNQHNQENQVCDINLIDTPGHADFTFEVIRSLRVLDGAVCILDGVAGVEAQTEKVWTQANGYQIPRIIYVNKLDRDGAAFARTVKEIAAKLGCLPALCMIPWWRGTDRKLQGLGDIIHLRGLLWKDGSDGRDIEAYELAHLENVDDSLAQEIKKARIALIELLSEHDDVMVEKYLEYEEDHLAIPSTDILASLRRCVLRKPQHLVPVFAGASLRNLGVQPLLDAVNHFLPSPLERPSPEISLGNQTGALTELLDGTLLKTLEAKALPQRAAQKPSARASASPSLLQSCALAFKVVNDAKRGVLVYVRVYSGSLTRGSALWNTNLNVMERAPRLLRMYANDAMEIQSIEAGQIGVIVGLKHARTGDTLVSYANMNPKNGPPAPINSLQLKPIVVPPPVFFVSVEPHSLSEEKQIMESLQILLREDPSLSISTDPETGQTHLAGMGELHLEIARDRLIQDFKAKATIGKIEISYRECILDEVGPTTANIDREIAGKVARASVTASIAPVDTKSGIPTPSSNSTETTVPLPDNNLLTISHAGLSPSSTASLPAHLTTGIMHSALTAGATAALAKGPTYAHALHSTHATLTASLTPDTSAAALSLAARTALRAALRTTPTALMEPVVRAAIAVPARAVGAVAHDLRAARGASIEGLGDGSDDEDGGGDGAAGPAVDLARVYAPPDPFGDAGGDPLAAEAMRVVTARVPLREMVGYLTRLRALTGGRGAFVMALEGFERVQGVRVRAVAAEMGRR